MTKLWHFTPMEEAAIAKAKIKALRFMQTYGQGWEPVTDGMYFTAKTKRGLKNIYQNEEIESAVADTASQSAKKNEKNR